MGVIYHGDCRSLAANTSRAGHWRKLVPDWHTLLEKERRTEIGEARHAGWAELISDLAELLTDVRSSVLLLCGGPLTDRNVPPFIRRTLSSLRAGVLHDSKRPVFYDGKPYKLERSPEKISALLHLADTSTREAFLVSEHGTEHGNPDELINIAPGDQFWTKKRDDSQKPVEKPIRYTVNGEQNTAVENPLSLESILRNAGAGAAIDVTDLGSYYLENTADGHKYANLDDLVTIGDGDNFLAIHVGSTPVA